jgi:hypothetical protein
MPDVAALVELRAHGKKAITEVVTEEEVSGPLSL